MKVKLNSPFPFVDKALDKVILSMFFATFIYVFLMVFQPFGIANITFYKPLFVLGFATITFIVVLCTFFLYPKLDPNFDNENWTVKKMFVFTVSQILAISLLNWVYASTIGKEVMEQHSLTKFFFITFSVGIIPSLFFILLIERFLRFRNEQEANKLTNNLREKSANIQNTHIELGHHQNKVSVYLSDLICIKAEGNYIEIYILEKDVLKKHLIRCPLSKVKEQLGAYNQIKHCHRSYILNTEHLTKITGNSRNFNLHLNHLNFSIPVSRRFPINTIRN